MIRGPEAIFDRYLGILGASGLEPGWRALSELSSAHLIRIPFENVSKIHRARVKGIRYIPSLEEFLDGIEHFHFGGTCYVNNYYLHLLLAHLGYEVKLCAADISVNGAPPDGHMVNVVTVDGKEAIVDVGYGAPFWHPIPRDSVIDVTVELGSERYVFKPKDIEGRSRLELYRDGQLRHGYLLKPAPRQVADFAQVVARSYGDGAPFLNSLVLIRFFNDRSVVLRNYTLTEFYGSETRTRTLATKEEIIDTIEKYFEIPAFVAREALDSLPELKVFNS
jgi:N-hydroxyarylamine O-acetyltransferase